MPSGMEPEPVFLPVRTISVPVVPPAGGLLVPNGEQLALLRERAKAAGTLKDLRQMVAAWEAVAEKCDLAYEELHRVAAFRLEVERDLGRELAQTVKRGGDRPKLPRGTLDRASSLPEGVSRKQSMIYQKLAAVPEGSFREYLEACRSRRTVPSSRGSLLYARLPKSEQSHRRSLRAQPAALELPLTVVDAVARCMDVDVLVGDASIHAGLRLQPGSTPHTTERLSGRVFVAQCPSPAVWIQQLQTAQRSGRISRVVLAVPAEPWHPWFETLVENGWVLCFLQADRSTSSGILLAHLGEKPGGFRLTMKAFGAVLG